MVWRAKWQLDVGAGVGTFFVFCAQRLTNLMGQDGLVSTLGGLTSANDFDPRAGAF